jgi:MtN3 and saliva related transmembrane protein
MNFTYIGYAAGFLTTLSFVPQVLKVCRSRRCEDLSWVWLAAFQTGLSLWFIYGLILKNWPMILANGVTMALCFVLMAMKARLGAPKTKSAAR